MAAREVTVHLIDGFGAKCGVCVCWPVFNGPLLSTGGAGDRAVNCPDCLARAEPAAPAGPENPPRVALRCRCCGFRWSLNRPPDGPIFCQPCWWNCDCDAQQVERLEED